MVNIVLLLLKKNIAMKSYLTNYVAFYLKYVYNFLLVFSYKYNVVKKVRKITRTNQFIVYKFII